MSANSVSAYPQLYYLARSYFHQDWDQDAPTALDVIGNFKADEPPVLTAALITELGRVLDSGMTDDQIGDLWLRAFRACYLPAEEGMTYRSWLTAILAVLSGTAAAGPRGASCGQ